MELKALINIADKIKTNCKQEDGRDLAIDAIQLCNLSEPIIFILDYHIRAIDSLISFALEVDAKNNQRFLNKFWSNPKANKTQVDTSHINSHIGYKMICIEGKTFYPYSVNLNNYTVDHKSIKKLFNDLHVFWNE